MAEYIDREKAIEFIRLNYCKDCNSYNGVRCRACSFDDAMLGIEDVPTADVVSKKAYEQVKWERDTAIEQLKSYGVGFCEIADVVEVVRCSQCKHLKVYNNDNVYAECEKIHLLFKPFETDTRGHFCGFGERKCENENPN